MCHNPFQTQYPTLWDLLQGTPFEDDARAAIQFSQAKERMKSALQERQFRLSELMWLLCGAVLPEWTNSEAAQLESDLCIIAGALGIGVAQTAYREKFLVEARSKNQDPKAKQLDAKNKLEDVRYEIAVTAKACAILDDGSIELEKPICDQDKNEKDWKNSDVFGTFKGQTVRIEVTVIHEALPPSIHLELDNFVRQANVSSGFRVVLRFALTDHGYAERVRALLELLHERHVDSNGTSVDIDGVRFEWKKGEYRCRQETSPFESICFYAADEFGESEKLKEIIHTCSVRPVTAKHVLEDHPNPPGVVTAGDLPDASTQVPVSTKIGQMLGGKLQQCEDGVINIVAFGNPLPMHDRELENALCGSTYVCVPFWIDRHGQRHSGMGVLQRGSKAPFVPEQHLGDDDRIQFTNPFKKMSAVWQIRLGGYAKNQVIPNPNALLPIPKELVEVLSDRAPSLTSNSTDEQFGLGKPVSDKQASVNGYQEEDIVWNEVARNYVEVCGTLTEARSVLGQLEQSGMSIDELRAIVESIWSNPTKEEKAMKFIAPTKMEMAMTFVVDCGGNEQAKACLDQFERDEKQRK
jgi:hypothetical protein